MAAVVGIDVATANVRASVVSAAGLLLGQGSHPLAPVSYPLEGWAEQDATTWWPATCRAVSQALSVAARNSGRAPSIAAVAVSGTSGTVVPVARDGEPLRTALMYSDRRASPQAERARSDARCGWDRLGLMPQAGFGYPKLLWLAANEPMPQGWSLCHVPDVVNWKLAGRPAPTDWSHALKSGYDPVAGRWTCPWPAPDDGGCVPPSVLPPGTLVGTVCEAAAADSGLPVGCEIRLGMTDSCAAQLACGAGGLGSYVSVLGTTLVLKGASSSLLSDPGGALYSHRHPEGWWLPGGASNTGGDALSAVPASELALLDQAASAMGPSTVVQYPLRRHGERFPFVEPAARGFVLGQPRSGVDAHRSVLEGVAFVERLGYERMVALGAAVPGRVMSAGAGGRSVAWLRIRATVLGRDLELPARSDTAYGAALLAAGSFYGTVTAASEAMLAPSKVVEGVPSEAAALNDSYGRFLEALASRGWLRDPPPGSISWTGASNE